jgi:hypothetical protein
MDNPVYNLQNSDFPPWPKKITYFHCKTCECKVTSYCSTLVMFPRIQLYCTTCSTPMVQIKNNPV